MKASGEMKQEYKGRENTQNAQYFFFYKVNSTDFSVDLVFNLSSFF